MEKLLRQRLDQPVHLADMARLAGLSVRTAVRACHAATGMPPGRRLKAIRLNHARNLLQLTDLPITEIALAVGYERVQELSRDMGKHYGQTPRAVRATKRDYTELEMPARPVSTRGPRPARATRRGGVPARCPTPMAQWWAGPALLHSLRKVLAPTQKR